LLPDASRSSFPEACLLPHLGAPRILPKGLATFSLRTRAQKPSVLLQRDSVVCPLSFHTEVPYVLLSQGSGQATFFLFFRISGRLFRPHIGSDGVTRPFLFSQRQDPGFSLSPSSQTRRISRLRFFFCQVDDDSSCTASSALLPLFCE